ncbi:unnamed protein product [Darwinula stevensoni]|uniref:Carboxylesterase type B domain-containing protein n=1 Tax=Darwinula stevensoni TaxID=69355 RepID=A0A7R8X6Z2_9CRUS|nr:unnamed protein product [Darwinula stevensoni]CAG0879954.1 unnamed protein product [Darwinula stevensoni]
MVEDGGYVFRGVPYTMAPVGERRWRISTPHRNISECWAGTYAAHNASTPCWQFYSDGRYDGAEDCLTVDVYTPVVAYEKALPVVVLVRGETFNGGMQGDLVPSVGLARRRNVVFVVVNYRLNVMGFLALRELSQGSPGVSGVSGNYGMGDVITALQWVQMNIQHFGGNFNSVTLLGHMAGATLVTALTSTLKVKDLTAPVRGRPIEYRTRRLFHRAWIASGSGVFVNESLYVSETLNTIIRERAGCSNLPCLMRQTPEILLEAVPPTWPRFFYDLPPEEGDKVRHSWLTIDGHILTQEPTDAWADDRFRHDVPLVFGTTTHAEYRGWTNQAKRFDPFVNTTDKMHNLVHSHLDSLSVDLATEAIQKYMPYTNGGKEVLWPQYYSMVTDLRTLCPLAELARKAATSFASPVYFYVAEQGRATLVGNVTDPFADVMAIIGMYNASGAAEERFRDNIQDLFYGFVYEGTLENNERYPRGLYHVGERVDVLSGYPKCKLWLDSLAYPRYARMD